MREQRKGRSAVISVCCGLSILAIGLPAWAAGPDAVKFTVVDPNGVTLPTATVELVGPSSKSLQAVEVGKGTWVVKSPGDKVLLRVTNDRHGGLVELVLDKSQGAEVEYKVVVGATTVTAEPVQAARPAAPTADYALTPQLHNGKPSAGQSYSRGCVADFSVSGAGTHMGNTCGAVNDCAFRASEEHTYEITIPTGGVWTFATCGSPFDTVIYLSTACCGGTTIASNDDACAPGSSISPSLAAGTYYLTIEAFGSTGCGDYTLNITAPPACNTDFTVNGPGTFMGDTCGAGNDCPLRASTEHIYQITLPNDGEWTFSLCGGATWDTYLFLGTDCCGGVLASSDDACAAQSEITANLTAGTYYVMVEAFSSSGCGTYTLDVSKAPPPPGCTGDTCAAAETVASIPFNDTGNTCSCNDDYNEACPYTQGGSGDTVYAYTPTQDECVDIILCNGTAYDTKMYVYENSCGAYDSGLFFACNDDDCTSPNFPAPYVSQITDLNLTAGNTYYIVVDGYSDDFIGPQCGDYVIDIAPCAGPCVTCPMGSTPENEPNCGLPDDTVNGGCNNPIISGGIDCCSAGACTDTDCFDAVCACDSFCCGTWDGACAGPNPFVPGCSAQDLCAECSGAVEYRFTDVACGQEICGSGGTDDITGFRDTDWFEIVTTQDTQFTWTVTADFPAAIGYIPTSPLGSGNCDDLEGVLDPFATGECEEISVTVCVGPGTHWFFVAPIDSTVCGSEYTARLDCVDCDAPEPPPNDDCTTAISVAVPSLTAGSTILAEVDGVPPCGTAVDSPGVWYQVAGTGNTITADTCTGADFDTKISVYCPDCATPFCVVGSDDSCGLQSSVSWCSEVGQNYYILVHGFGGEDGNFQLAVSDDGVACPNPPSCALCPGEGDCCVNNGTRGCNDEECCNTVCSCDPYCCGQDPVFGGFWDQDCADGSLGFGVPGCNAAALCEVCAPPPLTGACCNGLACSIQTEADCDAAGGNYLGDGASCVGAAGNPTTYSAAVGADIPDGGGPADPATHTMNVPDSFIMGDANVGVLITHTWVGDLIITVEHNGTSATIVDQPGAPALGTFGCPSNDLNIELDDQGTGGPVEDLCGPSDADPTPTSPPNYVPNNPLSVFAGMDAAGDWTITVSDNAGFDVGTLDAWALILDGVGENPCIPTGACCLWPDSCEVDSEENCDAQRGVYLGDDTVCIIPGPVQSYNADVNADIPDGGGPADPATHTMNVPGPLNIIDLDVDVNITHTWIGDLIITVEHNGTTVDIVDQPGVPALGTFGCNSNDLTVILDDSGTGGAVEDLCGANDGATTPGSPPNYVPNNPLSAFNGMDAAGDWTITVSDNAGFDVGTLDSWSLHFGTVGSEACDGAAFTGACCNGLNGACVDDVLSADCQGPQQTWYKVTLCSELDPPCVALVGACCITSTGICTDGVTQSACGGVWTQGASCSSVVCQPPPTGACCDRTSLVCTDGVTQANCTGEWSQGVLCDALDPPCVTFVPIPTVSEWGLVVLSLMLLIGMKFYFGIRREAQSA